MERNGVAHPAPFLTNRQTFFPAESCKQQAAGSGLQIVNQLDWPI